jgi:ABC-type Fe3+ transport system permease subunit
MNPIIQHDLMQARIAEMHRQARRTSTGKTAHAAIPRLRWLITGLAATVVALLTGAPAAMAINVPPPGENSGAPPPVVAHPAAAGGMPGWQIMAIAVGSALLASALTLLAVWMARRATQAQPSHP